MRFKNGWLLLGCVAMLASPSPASGQTCNRPVDNPLTVCSAQGGGSTACQNTIRAWDGYCKCLGYDGFNTVSGSCVGTPASAPQEPERPSSFLGLPPEIGGPAAFGAIGVGLGSFGTPDDMKMGGGAGVAAGAFLAAAVNKDVNPVVVAAMAGGGTWMAANAYGKKREAEDLQSAEDTQKQAALAAGAAAAVVGGISLINKAIGHSWQPPSALRRLRVAAAGKAVWVRWSW